MFGHPNFLQVKNSSLLWQERSARTRRFTLLTILVVTTGFSLTKNCLECNHSGTRRKISFISSIPRRIKMKFISVTVETMPDVQLSNPRLEGTLPESTYLGTPYNPHIMAYHAEKKRFLFIEDQTPDDEGRRHQRKRTSHTELAAQSSVHEPGRDRRANSGIVIMTQRIRLSVHAVFKTIYIAPLD